MDILGGLPLPSALVVLALIDSLSVGTLLIPIFFLLSPRLSPGRLITYLATIAAFYLAVGLLFLWGLVNLVDVAADFLASPVGLTLRLLIGVGLLVTALLIPAEKKHPVPTAAGEATGAAPTPPEAPRLVRWRERLLAPDTRSGGVIAVAILAGIVEVATMLPYIVAMTMLADAELSVGSRGIALVTYCVVMIVPALVLLLLRTVARRAIQPVLERLSAWMQRSGPETTAWIIGIIGFLIARVAATELGLFDLLARLFS